MAGITVGILLTNQIESEKTLYSILKKLTLNERIDFLSAYVYNQELDESIPINTVSKWLEISYKSNSYNQSEFICDKTNIKIQLVKIEEKIGFEIYMPYTFFSKLYLLDKSKRELLRSSALDIFERNSVDYLFVDFDENLELTKTEFKYKLMNEECYYILAIINDNNELLEFFSKDAL